MSPRDTPDRVAPGYDDPAYLLVHGWAADATVWDELRAHLPHDRRVLPVELRGHGGAPASATDYSPRTLASDVAACLRTRDPGPVIAVGHSLGGIVVSHLAVEHPELVSSVVVLDPAYGRPEGHEAAVERWVAEMRDDSRSALAETLPVGDPYDPRHTERYEALRDGARRLPRDVVWRTLHDIHLHPDSISVRPRSDRYLRRRTQPVLALNRDPERARWEDSVLVHPLSRSLAWPQSGHYLQIEHAPDLADALMEWTELCAGRRAELSLDTDGVGSRARGGTHR